MINPIQTTPNILGMRLSRIYNFKEIKMKNLIYKWVCYLINVSVALCGVFIIFPQSACAQSYNTNSMAIVLEDSLLSTNNKKIVLVIVKDMAGPIELKMQTTTSEGIVNQFKPLRFEQGLKRGQTIQLWNGDFNSFYSTPWLYFSVTASSPTMQSYSSIYFPVNYMEQYKEPMITSIKETGGYGVDYNIKIEGIFDTTVPSIILINTNFIIPPKTITQTPPGKIEFNVNSNSRDIFPPGKYLLTICQESHCDTLVGRHR